jgi:hypothetical protein
MPQTIIERMKQLSKNEGIIINMKLTDWRRSKDVEEYMNQDETHLESQQLKEISSDLDLDITARLNDENDSSYEHTYSQEPLSLEDQSNIMIDEFNPNSPYQQQSDDIDDEYLKTNYWKDPISRQ